MSLRITGIIRENMLKPGIKKAEKVNSANINNPGSAKLQRLLTDVVEIRKATDVIPREPAMGKHTAPKRDLPCDGRCACNCNHDCNYNCQCGSIDNCNTDNCTG